MIALADNPAVSDPKRTLSPTQKDALCAIAFFKHQFRSRRGWRIGNKQFSFHTIERLAEHGLVSRGNRSIVPTIAGSLAIDRLKGTPA